MGKKNIQPTTSSPNLFDELVDKAYRGKSAERLLDAPVSALKGVSEGDECKLKDALGIKTIEDLAMHWSVQHARAITEAHSFGVTPLGAMATSLTENAATPKEADQNWDQLVSSLLSGSGTSGSPSLLGAWSNLQVYSYYALGLPTTENDLKVKLNVQDFSLLTAPIAKAMTDNYGVLASASKDFLDKVYNPIVDLGNNLLNFATDATATDGTSIFQTIVDLLYPPNSKDGSKPEPADPASALELIQDRLDTATTNATKAEKVKQSLTDYKTKLATGQMKLTTLKTTLDNNESTSAATINKLSGGKDVAGSLKSITSLLTSAQDRYSHDVIVAATTPTYAWVLIPPGIPAGLIAASVVAGVYGKRATDELSTIHKLQTQLENAEHDLQVAVKTQAIQHQASTGVNQAITYTDAAIRSATVLQLAWNKLANGLGVIKSSLSKAIKDSPDGQPTLASKAVVKVFVNKSKISWGAMKPTLQTLIDNAYIVTDPSTKTEDWNKFMNKVESKVQQNH